ncbi:hypothetical protein SNEBB_001119 [Seison nebaliae]|nr:hypothetical protein SNEBB_001119 [Seison nebaliae]
MDDIEVRFIGFDTEDLNKSELDQFGISFQKTNNDKKSVIQLTMAKDEAIQLSKILIHVELYEGKIESNIVFEDESVTSQNLQINIPQYFDQTDILTKKIFLSFSNDRGPLVAQNLTVEVHGCIYGKTTLFSNTTSSFNCMEEDGLKRKDYINTNSIKISADNLTPYDTISSGKGGIDIDSKENILIEIPFSTSITGIISSVILVPTETNIMSFVCKLIYVDGGETNFYSSVNGSVNFKNEKEVVKVSIFINSTNDGRTARKVSFSIIGCFDEAITSSMVTPIDTDCYNLLETPSTFKLRSGTDTWIVENLNSISGLSLNLNRNLTVWFEIIPKGINLRSLLVTAKEFKGTIFTKTLDHRDIENVIQLEINQVLNFPVDSFSQLRDIGFFMGTEDETLSSKNIRIKIIVCEDVSTTAMATSLNSLNCEWVNGMLDELIINPYDILIEGNTLSPITDIMPYNTGLHFKGLTPVKITIPFIGHLSSKIMEIMLSNNQTNVENFYVGNIFDDNSTFQYKKLNRIMTSISIPTKISNIAIYINSTIDNEPIRNLSISIHGCFIPGIKSTTPETCEVLNIMRNYYVVPMENIIIFGTSNEDSNDLRSKNVGITFATDNNVLIRIIFYPFVLRSISGVTKVA